MANVKISDLTAYVDPASSDILPIVDLVNDVTKKVTIADLLENAGDGSAAAPAFAFNSDSNTGIYRSGADELSFATGGTQRLVISSSGVVSVNGNTVLTAGEANSVTSAMIVDGTIVNADINASAAIAGTKVSPNFGSQNVLTTGNVGIGTAAPASKLDVKRTDAAGNYFYAGASSDNGIRGLQFSSSNNGVYLGAAHKIDATSSGGSIALATGGTERLKIDSAGNAGIGTTSPSDYTGGGYKTLTINGTTNGGVLDLKKANTHLGQVASTSSAVSLSSYDTVPLVFNTASNERMRIDASGRLGLGTSSPGTKLHVAGDVKVVNTGVAYLQPNTVTAFQAYEPSGPVKISLNNNGSATFAGSIVSNGGFESSRTGGTSHVFRGRTGSGLFTTTILANGSATFAGPLTVYDALAASATDSSFTIRNPGNTADVASIDGNGSATFAGVGTFSGDLRVQDGGNFRVRTAADSASDAILLQNNGSITAFGDATINSLTIGRGAGSVATNTTVGNGALQSNTNGASNTAIGRDSLYNNTTGSNNTGNGFYALRANISGGANVANGYYALSSNTTGTRNVASGYQALYSNTTGNYNVANGSQALYTNTTGSNNVAVGKAALYQNTTAVNNTAIGDAALYANTTGNYNVATGYEALKSVTTASDNVATGFETLRSNTGRANTAAGRSALRSNSSGQENVALGAYSMYSNTTARDNTAVGYGSLEDNTTGANNVAIGHRACGNNTTASNNVGVGRYALYTNTTGSNNAATGLGALQNNTTGSNNVANGWHSLYTNSTGVNHVAIGREAMALNTTGNSSVGVGPYALYYNTTGNNNTAFGAQALFNVSTGSGNIGIGPLNSSGSYAPVFDATTHSNRYIAGHASISHAYVKVSWTVTSDERDKMNFAPVPYGLDFVNQLKPTAYQFKVDRDTETPNGDVRYGFKAQDILALEGDNPVIIDTEDADHLKYKGEHLVPVLVNAVQELTAMVEELQNEVAALKSA
jgi:hypothetical protein